MKEIALDLINEESFIEESIIDVERDMEDKRLVVKIDGGMINTGEYLSKAEIVFSDWSKLEVVERRGNDYNKLAEPPQNFLTSVMGFQYHGGELKLTDVGYNCWVDWIFSDAKVKVYGEIDKDTIDE